MADRAGVATITGVSPSGRRRVFNLSVAGQPEYFANGLLTHNCNFTPDGYDGSPDRVDALVWAATDLLSAGKTEVF